MNSVSIRLAAEPLRSLALSAMSGTYMGIGSRLATNARFILIQNLTNAIINISFDGISDHAVLPSDSYWLTDGCWNEALGEGFYISEGQRIYANIHSLFAPPVGSVYLSVFYGDPQ